MTQEVYDAAMHPIFEGMAGHETLLKILERMADRPAGAYLFVGPRHVGKKLIAERFARLLLGISLTDSLDAHPDFFRVTREEGAKELTVKQARELITRMHLTSARGGKKIALVEQADRWNEEACNALLKALEEPSPNKVYLFVAQQAEKLPATLRSRLTMIPFLTSPHHSSTPLLSITPLLSTLATAPLGVQCQALEKLSQQMESNEDPTEAWQDHLLSLMHELTSFMKENPVTASRIGHGLIHAWHLTSTTLSPRLALEWAAIKPYISEDISLPSFLDKSYL